MLLWVMLTLALIARSLPGEGQYPLLAQIEALGGGTGLCARCQGHCHDGYDGRGRPLRCSSCNGVGRL